MYNNFFDVNSYSQSELDIIEKLLTFNKQIYLQKYNDVAIGGFDPLIHFMLLGMYEHRFPWLLSTETTQRVLGCLSSSDISLQEFLGFDVSFYTRTYPDVPSNYFQHFIECGIRERRLPFDFYDNVKTESIVWQIMDKFGLECGESLDQQLYFKIQDGSVLIQELLDEVNHQKVLPKTYRNNFWLLMGVGFSAQGFFGAASLCYNYFYNYFLPMPQLGNWQHGVYITGKVKKTIDYAQGRNWVVKPLVAATNISVSNPLFLNRSNAEIQDEVHMLPIPHYCVLENVVLIGGNSMIYAGGHDLIYDYLDVDQERKVEFKGPNILHAVNDSCTMKYIYSDLEEAEAFSLMHDHGHNYFHWLIEVLPRYLLARKNGLVSNVPLLIDEKIGKLQEEVMRLILGNDVVLIKIPRNTSIRVGKLHWVSDLSVNTVHTLALPKKSDILISPTAIELLREVGVPNFIRGITKCEKLLIIRTNVEFRRLINRYLFRNMLTDAGFWSFNPGQASFDEQVRVFSNARIIITEAGAAQANMVFCQPNATMVVLVNGYKNSNYFYLVQMAQTIGLKLVFFECLRLDGSHELGVHDDMIVNIGGLKQEINELLTSQDDNYIDEITPVVHLLSNREVVV